MTKRVLLLIDCAAWGLTPRSEAPAACPSKVVCPALVFSTWNTAGWQRNAGRAPQLPPSSSAFNQRLASRKPRPSYAGAAPHSHHNPRRLPAPAHRQQRGARTGRGLAGHPGPGHLLGVRGTGVAGGAPTAPCGCPGAATPCSSTARGPAWQGPGAAAGPPGLSGAAAASPPARPPGSALHGPLSPLADDQPS